MATCEEKIRGGSSWRPSYRLCGKPAKMEHEGKHYCGIHNPVMRAEKRKAIDRKWDEQAKENGDRRRLEYAAPELLAVLESFPMLLGKAETAFGKKVQDWQDKALVAIAKARGEA